MDKCSKLYNVYINLPASQPMQMKSYTYTKIQNANGKHINDINDGYMKNDTSQVSNVRPISQHYRCNAGTSIACTYHI